MMLQKLWLLKIDWDDPIPQDLQDAWKTFVTDCHHLSSIQVPRNVLCDSPINIEIHIFSDASQCAYGACAYLKSYNKYNEVTVNLLCSKSKVSPLKPTTIPRLELCAALLAARLSKCVQESIKYTPSRIVH